MTADLNGNHVPMPGGYEVVLTGLAQWHLSWVTPGIRKAFSSYAFIRAKERFADDKESTDWLRGRFAAGGYDWGNPLDENGMGSDLHAFMNSEEGGAKLLLLLLAAKHGNVSLADLAEAFKGHEEDFKEALIRCIDPNRRTPKESGKKWETLMTTQELMASVTPISSPSSMPQD